MVLTDLSGMQAKPCRHPPTAGFIGWMSNICAGLWGWNEWCPGGFVRGPYLKNPRKLPKIQINPVPKD
jgi:hypothetical protein